MIRNLGLLGVRADEPQMVSHRKPRAGTPKKQGQKQGPKLEGRVERNGEFSQKREGEG